jgi:pyruvate/2-oxoglutarate/acetoin dehydrogenase E1 component
MKNYCQEIIRSMELLASNKKTIFLGQSVTYPGSLIYQTLKSLPKKKKIELPVFEEVQMGISIGLALEGYIPVTCYPRFDFLILALNQLINHADKIDHLTNGDFKSRIIVRTLIGATKPLDAGPQHTQDYTAGLKKMLRFTKIIRLTKNSNIYSLYKNALTDKKNKVFLFIEDSNLYN